LKLSGIAVVHVILYKTCPKPVCIRRESIKSGSKEGCDMETIFAHIRDEFDRLTWPEMNVWRKRNYLEMSQGFASGNSGILGWHSLNS
jgi:hypothetical protein